MSLPRSIVAQIRTEIHWIGQPIDWFEANLPQVNIVHVLIFMLLTIATKLAFTKLDIRVFFTLLLLFAIGTEAIQLLVPGRTPRLNDLFADALGILIGLTIWLAMSKIGQFLHSSGKTPVE